MSKIENSVSEKSTGTMPKLGVSENRAESAVSWRAILIGCLLIPVNCYWIMQMEIIRYANFPTSISLFFTAIFTLLVMVGLNILLRRYTPRWALTQAELLVIYIMVTLASALAGHDMIQIVASMMGHYGWYATPENRWEDLFGKLLPNWLYVKDKAVLRGFYMGDSSLYYSVNWQGWLRPVLCWSGFITLLVFIMLCMNTLLRKQWAERERLSYPLITLPIEMTDPSLNLFRNKLMWIGFALAGALDIFNGINMIFPNFPAFPIKATNIASSFPDRPWNAMNPVQLGFYPFAIGLGALLPLDLCFSCWFFYIFWKMQFVATSAAGLNSIPGFPFVEYQSFGAYMGIATFALYTSRKALWDVLKRAVGAEAEVRDEGEALSYRTALIGTVLGFGLLLYFSHAVGMSLWLGVLFFILYFLLCLAITRMRAELGPPAHDLHNGGPDRILATVGGQQNMGTSNLVGLSAFYWFNRAYRSHPMPIQLESYKIAEKQKMSYRRVFVAMMLAVVIGTLASFWIFLYLTYDRGAATAKVLGPITGNFGPESFKRLANWLNSPKPTDVPGTTAIGVGIVFTLLLQTLRMRFFWFPFHPVGYAVSSSWAMSYLWAPLFFAWLIKLIILRYGGMKSFQKAIPFFLGLILGEYVIGSLWAIIGILLNLPTYSFWV